MRDTASSTAAAAFVRFPPRWRTVLVPTAPPAATALGMTMYTASKPVPWCAQMVLWSVAVASRGRVLLGAREAWTPPVAGPDWTLLREQWSAALGARVDGVAAYHRLDAHRQALTLLVSAGRHGMLVRVRADAESLAQERAVSATAQRMRPRGFRVPARLGGAAAGAWHWVGYELMSRRPHRPRYHLDASATEEISALVESVVPRPADVPAHWRAAHRDLTPWNLRRGSGATWLIDWEDAGWAPPQADDVYLRGVVRAIRPGRVDPVPVTEHTEEACRYWADIVDSRVVGATQQRLRSRLLQAFGAVA